MIGRRLHLGLYAALALALGLALRVWFVVHVPDIATDSIMYGSIAKNWMQHGVYGFAQRGATTLPTLIRLPGYPLFLVACFRLFGVEHYTAVMWVQTVLDLFSCGLIAALAGRLFGRRAGLAALWLSALCPFTANYIAAPLTEIPTLGCIALTFYALERWRAAGLGLNRWLWVTSAAMAYALLLRPEQVLLPAAVLPAMLWMAWKSRGRLATPLNAISPVILPVFLSAVCVVLPLLPWTIRNWRTFHQLQPLAPRQALDPGELLPLGFERWYRSWAIDYASTEDVYWNYDGANIEISDLPTRAFDSDDQYTRTEALLTDYNRTKNPSSALEARFNALAEERIKADPIRYYITLPVARLIDMFLRPRTEILPLTLEWWKWRETPAQSVIAAALAALNLAYLALGAVGLWLWRRRQWSGNPALAWAMMGYAILRCALLLTLDNSEPRYTLEFFPLIFVWSALVFAGPRSSSPSSGAAADS